MRTNLKIYIHQLGLYKTDLPSAYARISLDSNKIEANIEHQVTELLNFDGNTCTIDSEHRLDICRYDHIHKVNINKKCLIILDNKSTLM